MQQLLSEISQLADEIGMGDYWSRIVDECKQEHEEFLDRLESRGQMPALLENNRPTDEQVLLVQTLNGTERKIIHLWAEHHHYKHKAIKTPLFPSVRVYRCKDCQRSYAKSELRERSDWSTIHPGVSYGTIIYCDECGSTCDGCEDDDLVYKGHMFNALAISLTDLSLPKHLTRYSKKQHDNSSYSEKDLLSMELRQVRLMDRNECETFHNNLPRPVHPVSEAKQARINRWSDSLKTVDNTTVDNSLKTVDNTTVDNSLKTVDNTTVDNSLKTVDNTTVDNTTVDNTTVDNTTGDST